MVAIFGIRFRFPPPPFSNEQKDNELGKSLPVTAARGQRCQSLESLLTASNVVDSQFTSQSQSVCLPPAVAKIVDAWPFLPPHIREAIQTLADAGLPADCDMGPPNNCAPLRAHVLTDEAAWRIAKECRGIVQACLREEEWPDADREFFGVIRAGLPGQRPN